MAESIGQPDMQDWMGVLLDYSNTYPNIDGHPILDGCVIGLGELI